MNLARAAGQASSGVFFGRVDVVRALQTKCGLAPDEATLIHDFLLAQFDALTAQADHAPPREAYAIKAGALVGAEQARLPCTLHIIPKNAPGAYRAPAVVVTSRVLIGEGAQKRIQQALVLVKNGAILHGLDAAKVRALDTRAKTSAEAERNRAALARELELGVPLQSGPATSSTLRILLSYELPRGAARELSPSSAPLEGPHALEEPRVTKQVVIYERLTGGLDKVVSASGRRPSEPMQRDIMLRMARALESLHDRNILHNDVKTSNFLFDHVPPLTRRIVLSDLAFAKAMKDGVAASSEGTWVYASPSFGRQMLEDKEDILRTPADDVFALGVTFHQVAHGELPAFVNRRGEWAHFSQLSHLTQEDVEKQIPEGPFKNLISGMLDPDASRRWSLPRVLAALEETSPFLSSFQEFFATPRLNGHMKRAWMQQLTRSVVLLHEHGRVHGAIGPDLVSIYDPPPPPLQPSKPEFRLLDPPHASTWGEGSGPPSPPRASKVATETDAARWRALVREGQAEDIRALGHLFDAILAATGDRPPALQKLVDEMVDPQATLTARGVFQELYRLGAYPDPAALASLAGQLDVQPGKAER